MKKSTEQENLTPVFSQLVISIASAALDKIKPDSQSKESRDRTMARYNIDLLSVLKEKTKNNLTKEEAVLLNNCIQDLQLKFVQTENASPSSEVKQSVKKNQTAQTENKASPQNQTVQTEGKSSPQGRTIQTEGESSPQGRTIQTEGESSPQGRTIQTEGKSSPQGRTAQTQNEPPHQKDRTSEKAPRPADEKPDQRGFTPKTSEQKNSAEEVKA